MNPLKPKKIKATKGKKIEPLVTPEAEDFRRESGKLDNWLNHRRITEYFTEEEEE